MPKGAVLQLAFKIEKIGETRWAELKRNTQMMGRRKWETELKKDISIA